MMRGWLRQVVALRHSIRQSLGRLTLCAGYAAGVIPDGLCADCSHAQRNQTRRGPVYLRCLLASLDASYPRYPRLPVLRCAGHAPVTVRTDRNA
jgi:hypothetical protein